MTDSLDKEASSFIDTRGNLLDRARKSGLFRHWRVGLVFLLFATVVAVVVVAISRRVETARCPQGRVPNGHRCCWSGQALSNGHCIGSPDVCTAPYVLESRGCRLMPEKIFVAGGTLRVAPNDWQAQGALDERTLQVAGFFLDRTEVTDESGPEPFLPRTRVDFEEAEAACRRRGGRLPSADEWLFAAAGADGRRFPWGQTGLVCRRAVFGLVDGPCATSVTPGPDAVGSRPDGASPLGLLDLVGNVAEWASDGESRWAMGGSFRSQVASELKVWSRERVAGSRDDVGFRCAYDAPPVPDASGKNPPPP